MKNQIQSELQALRPILSAINQINAIQALQDQQENITESSLQNNYQAIKKKQIISGNNQTAFFNKTIDINQNNQIFISPDNFTQNTEILMNLVDSLNSQKSKKLFDSSFIYSIGILQNQTLNLQSIENIENDQKLDNEKVMKKDQIEIQSAINENLVPQISADKEMQNVLQAQQQEIEDKISQEANAKLVKDLKTLTTVLEANERLKNREIQQRKQNLIVDQKNNMIEQTKKQVVSIINQPLKSLNKKQQQSQLLKNATNSLETMLKSDSESKAVQEVSTALGFSGQDQANQTKQVDESKINQELLKNAATAIQGLIKLSSDQDSQDTQNINIKKAIINQKMSQGLNQEQEGEQEELSNSENQKMIVSDSVQDKNNIEENSSNLAISSFINNQESQISNKDQQVLDRMNPDNIQMEDSNSQENQASNQLQMQQVINYYIQNIQKSLNIKQTEDLQNTVSNGLQQVLSEVPKQDKVLDFLSALGKISSIILTITPLPTYFGVWNKQRKEQIRRVESIGFSQLLLSILNNSIWTSYAFKTQNIDLAIISVIPLTVSVILTSIYLSVKPEHHLIKQFFVSVLVCQIFNFDLLSTETCGTLGTSIGILSNFISLSNMPRVIETRDVRGFNLPNAYLNLFNILTWTLYAIIKFDPFMSLNQIHALSFSLIQLMFYYWAKGQINGIDTPELWKIMKQLIWFFSLFIVKEKCKEMQSFFWQDETTDEAQIYIKQYKDDISELEQKYADNEKSYEEHIRDMRKINEKLERISQGKYQLYKNQKNGDNSDKSTNAGSQDDYFYQQQNILNINQYEQNGMIRGNLNQQHFGEQIEQNEFIYRNRENPNYYYQNKMNQYGAAEDSISMTSFNSSINFAKLQNSINFRASLSNQSQSTSYFKQRIQNISHRQLEAASSEACHQQIQFNENNLSDITLQLDDFNQNNINIQISSMPKLVEEVQSEEEYSQDQSFSHVGFNQDIPRSSVESLIQMIEQNPIDSKNKLISNSNLQSFAQNLKNFKNQKEQENQYSNDKVQMIDNNIPQIIDQSFIKNKGNHQDLKSRAEKLKFEKKQKKQENQCQQNQILKNDCVNLNKNLDQERSQMMNDEKFDDEMDEYKEANKSLQQSDQSQNISNNSKTISDDENPFLGGKLSEFISQECPQNDSFLFNNISHQNSQFDR